MIGDLDEKSNKRTIKRVVLHKILEQKSKKSNKPRVVMIVWKGGLFEEDTYTRDKFKK
jgi:hypothetical protein